MKNLKKLKKDLIDYINLKNNFIAVSVIQININILICLIKKFNFQNNFVKHFKLILKKFLGF